MEEALVPFHHCRLSRARNKLLLWKLLGLRNLSVMSAGVASTMLQPDEVDNVTLMFSGTQTRAQNDDVT